MKLPASGWADGRLRCSWARPGNAAYVHYHDCEWGRPLRDDRRLFELLILENFQAGLSWECVLNRREAFRRAFDGFDPDIVRAYGEKKLAELAGDAGIIRNRAKIGGAVANAAVFCRIREEWGSFAAYLWHWCGDAVVHEAPRSESPLSRAISRDLAARGMKFAGPVIVQAYLQAAGLICSHEHGCFLADPCPVSS